MDLERNDCSEFLRKAYEMVNDPSTDPVISWSPNGLAFIVWIPEECKRDILPKYLNVKSFGRFDYYGFQRIMSRKEQLVFACTDFMRGKPELLDKICQRHMAQCQASHDKIYKPLEDRLKICTTKEEVELAHKEHRERCKKDIMDQREAIVRLKAASQEKARQHAAALEAEAAAIEAKAAEIEAKAVAALALEDQLALEAKAAAALALEDQQHGVCRLESTKERLVFACNDFVRGKPELWDKILSTCTRGESSSGSRINMHGFDRSVSSIYKSIVVYGLSICPSMFVHFFVPFIKA